MGRLITISGIDCSGKSTQIDRLRARLAAEGLTAEVLWHRPGYSPELDRARALIRRLRPQAIPAPGASADRDRAFQKPGVSTAWIAAALTDLLLQYGAKLRWRLAQCDVVICDRYLPDACLDLALRFPSFAPWLPRLEPWLARCCPRPDCALVLTLPEDEMRRRAAEKNEPFPDAPELQRARFRAYTAFARGQSDAPVPALRRWLGPRLRPVDAAGPIDVVHQRVLSEWTACG